jgi:hypothetical protein
MSRNIPSKAALFEVVRRLKEKNIEFALGGSGLLFFFGCDTTVHDWDITTDASAEHVESALSGLSYEKKDPEGIFVSKFLFKINIGDTFIDLIGAFALKTEKGVYRVPTIVTEDWDGIPIGDPQAWITVYELLGKTLKAQQLLTTLQTRIRT